MKSYVVLGALTLCAVIAMPAVAEETEEARKEVKIMGIPGDESGLLTVSEDEGCCVVKVTEDGKKKVIRIDKDGLLQTGDELDTGTRVKLLDEKIKFIKASAGLRTDLAVARVELAKLKLADKPDQVMVDAKKKQVQELESKLKAKTGEYREAVKGIAPGCETGLLMLDCCGEEGLLGLELMLPGTGDGLIKKCIQIKVEEDDD